MEREKQISFTRWTHRNENSRMPLIKWHSCTPCIISLVLKHLHPILYHPHTSHFLCSLSLSCELGGRPTFPLMVLKRTSFSFPIPRSFKSKMFCNKPFSRSILCKSIFFHTMMKAFHRHEHSDNHGDDSISWTPKWTRFICDVFWWRRTSFIGYLPSHPFPSMFIGGFCANQSHLISVVFSHHFHIGHSKQLFSRDSFDINTTITEYDGDKESLLFDAMDPGLLSGPASFLQDEL